MTKQGKRWLGALLALCMVAGMFPVISVGAEGTDTVVTDVYMDTEEDIQADPNAEDAPPAKWVVVETIPCKYDGAKCFDEGLAAVELNGKWGFIDKTGAEVTSFKYDKYDRTIYFCEGLVAVRLNGKYGFIDKTGTEVIPCKYDDMRSFCEGFAAVKLNGKWGFIDKNGVEVAPCEYDWVWDFSEGLAGVRLNDRHGFIDKTGAEVIPCKYGGASSFSEDLALVSQNYELGYIDKTGAEVIPLKYDNAQDFSDGLAKVRLNGKWGFIDKSGTEVIPCKYDSVGGHFSGMGDFRDGLTPVILNGKYGFVDKAGTEVIPCKYDQAWDFCEGLAEVRLNDKWGFVDNTGVEVIPCKYDVRDGSHPFCEGLAAAKLNGKWGYIDKAGTEVTLFKYDWASDFSEGPLTAQATGGWGLAVVELNGKYGLVDKTGTEVAPCKYDYIYRFCEGFAAVVLNGKWGFIDKNGVEVVPCEYDGVEGRTVYDGHFFDGLAAVQLNGKCGFISVINANDPSHQHTETPVVTPPTCVDKGYTTYTCSVCGNVRQGDETAALGHDYQLNADKSVAATPGHDGYEYYECTRNPAHFYKTPIIAPIVTHTATFMVGDEIIDQVVFEEGAATLDEPALPQRPNYVGQWEPYDLAAATSDITVHGLYTPVDPDAVSDVDAGAKAEYENGEVTMELSARAASRTIKVVSQQTKPVDVVLVLDQSGSMAETLSSRDRQSKRDALVSCANSFVAELHKNAVDTGADHRVAVVGFAYSAYNKGNYKNTGLLATANGKIINYNSIKNSDYATALLPINNDGRINANVVTGINSIVADGATAADLGLKMARNIFAENPIQSERERIVIFITDGTPTSWGEDADLVRQTAAAAISEANMLKNGQGAKIYSVGVHANADPTVSFTSAKDGVTTNSRGQFTSYDFNRFLHAVSSNYPNAAAMSNLGAGNKADGYYMGVKDTSNLGSIFTNILYSTVYELKSFDKATLYYTLSPEFTLTMEQELAMREELQAQGLADSDIQVIRNQDGTTQFRFQNVKTQAVYGEDGTLHYEAKVRFKVSANQSAPAGGSVSTGTGSNGVEYEGSQIASLETPMVSIPQNRCLVAFTINGQVYQLREMAAGEVITLPDTELASWSVPAGAVVSGEYAVFEADSAPEQKHTIRWIIDGTEILEQYALGQVIVPPAVPVKEEYDFTGWSRSIPYSMPAYDLVCEAIYSPAHTHSFELAYQTGSCREGLTIVYRCACGETQSMTERPAEHNFVAVLVDNGSTGTEVEKVVCTKCGHSEEQNINFKVSYSTGWKTTVLDLNLLQNEVNVVQPEAEIEMRFFVGEDGGRLYTVTRIDSDGKRTTYQTRAENGYLVFRANHFSIYVISELDETTSQPTETVSYEEAVNILDSKVDATPTAPLDGTSSSNNNRPSNGGSTRPTAKPAEETPVFSFADVAEQDWYYDSAKYVYEKGLMQGISATAFAPDQTTSRAMIATILWRLADSPAMGGGKSGIFPDVPEDEWYTEAVEWAAVQGVVKGHDDGNFRPTDLITREQLAVMLYRYAGNPTTAGTLDGFVDMNKASDYALDALRWATEQGILTGKGSGLLDPQGQATRAEAAAMLQRFCESKG